MSEPSSPAAAPTFIALGGLELIVRRLDTNLAWQFRRTAIRCIQSRMTTAMYATLAAVAEFRAAGEPLAKEDVAAMFHEAIAIATGPQYEGQTGGKRKPTEDEIQDWTMTAEGMGEYLLLATRGNEPPVTRDWMRTVVTEDTLIDVLTKNAGLIVPVPQE